MVFEKSNEQVIQKGDYVFLETGIPAPTGRYRLGFMKPKLVVENGKFLKYD